MSNSTNLFSSISITQVSPECRTKHHTEENNLKEVKQNGHCTHNITLRNVLATIVAQENKYYILLMCVCSLSYPVHNAHAPYCHLRPARLYSIFPHYLINGTIKKKVIENKMCGFIYSTTFV